jgi:hypothetical protein
LELIRYIHLNPLRAKLLQDLKELDKYPWTGHSAILSRRKNPLVPEIRDLKSGVRNQTKSNQVGKPNGTKKSSPPPQADCFFSFVRKLKKTTKIPKIL